MTAPVITEQERLSLRIGATEEHLRRILRDLTEDEAVLLLLHEQAPPPDAGWEDEDECAEFIKSTQDAITQMWADLGALYEELDALLAAAGGRGGGGLTTPGPEGPGFQPSQAGVPVSRPAAPRRTWNV